MIWARMSSKVMGDAPLGLVSPLSSLPIMTHMWEEGKPNPSSLAWRTSVRLVFASQTEYSSRDVPHRCPFASAHARRPR